MDPTGEAPRPKLHHRPGAPRAQQPRMRAGAAEGLRACALARLREPAWPATAPPIVAGLAGPRRDSAAWPMVRTPAY